MRAHLASTLLWLTALPAQTPAERFVPVGNTPGILLQVAYDPNAGRLLAIDLDGATWTMRGGRWSRVLPDGIGGTQIRTPLHLGFDRAQREVVGVLTADLNGLDSYAHRSGGWQFVSAGNFLAATTPPTHAAIACDPATNELMTFGGTEFGFEDSMFSWDGSAWSQLPSTARPTARTMASMATDRARNRVVLFGGRAPLTGDLSDTWEWDGQTWTQILTTGAPTPRTQPGIAFDPIRQRIVLAGGFSEPIFSYFDDCYEWDGASWSLRPTLPRLGRAFAYDDGTSLFVIVGDAVFQASSAGYTQVTGDTDPAPYLSPAMAFDPLRNETILVSGSPTAGTWRWDNQWQLVTRAGPPPRHEAALAVRGTDLILFGGYDFEATPPRLFDDTWRWNGQNWAQVPVATRPPARQDHAMSQSPGGALLFGGRIGGSVLSDTWRFDGLNWTQQGAVFRPQARAGHSMTYDPLRNRAVMHGGRDGSFRAIDDTWEWDGLAWIAGSPITVIHGNGRRVPIAFDPTRGQVVAADETGTLWGWSGTSWTVLSNGNGPTVGIGVFDARQQRLLQWSVTTSMLTATPANAEFTQSSPQVCGNPTSLRMFGRPAVGTNASVHIEGTTSAPALLVLGLQPQSLPIAPGCSQLVATDAVVFGLLDSRGMLDVPLAPPDNLALRGVQVMAQVAVLDGGPALGASVSGALRITVGD